MKNEWNNKLENPILKGGHFGLKEVKRKSDFVFDAEFSFFLQAYWDAPKWHKRGINGTKSSWQAPEDLWQKIHSNQRFR